jgi:hypothetical protein
MIALTPPPVCCANAFPNFVYASSRARKRGGSQWTKARRARSGLLGARAVHGDQLLGWTWTFRRALLVTDHFSTPLLAGPFADTCLFRLDPARYCLLAKAVSTTPRPHRVPTRFLRREEAIDSCTVVS